MRAHAPRLTEVHTPCSRPTLPHSVTGVVLGGARGGCLTCRSHTLPPPSIFRSFVAIRGPLPWVLALLVAPDPRHPPGPAIHSALWPRVWFLLLENGGRNPDLGPKCLIAEGNLFLEAPSEGKNTGADLCTGTHPRILTYVYNHVYPQ